ncbi:hypothetical protein BH20GEM2_BH20GEM2_21490 [soil metagenome]
MSLNEAAMRLGVTDDSLRAKARRRSIPLVVAGGGKRLRAADLEGLAA